MKVRDEIRDWLSDQLASRPRGTKAALARALGVSPDAITRMLNNEPGKEARRISADEHIKMQTFFAALDGQPVDQSSLIREQAMQVFDELPPDLQQLFATQLDALAELARARRSAEPDRQEDQG